MKQLFLFFFIIFSTYILKSQTKNHHLIGVNFEYSNMPKMINARLGSNLTYLYAYKRFCIKVEAGILPGSNFGTLYKTCLNFGTTTDLNKPISVHILGGLGGVGNSKNYIYKELEYDADIGYLNLDLGTYVRPTKNERLFAGLDMMLTAYDIHPTGTGSINLQVYEGNSYRGFLFFFNLSINYKLNKPKSSIKN